MKITAIHASNFLGARAVDLQLTKRVNLIAGSNGAGKSSLRDAIALALTADLGRVSLKKDAPALVTDGADAAHVQVDTENFSSSVSITASGKIVDSLKGVQVPDVLRFVLDAQRFARLEPKDRRAFLFDLMGLKAGGDAVRERLLAKGADKTKVERIVPLLRAGFDAASKEAKEKATQAKGAWRALTGETYGSEKAKTWRAAAPAFDAAKGKDLATKLQHCEAALEQWQQQVGKLQAEQQRRAQLQAKLPALDERAGRLERIETKLEADKKGLAEAEKAVHEAGVAAGQAPRTGLIHELAWAVDNMLLHGDSLDPADPMDARVLASLAAYEREHGKVQRSEPEHDPAAAARLPQLRASRDLMESAVKNSQRDQTAALQARDEAESIRAELAETFDAAGMDEARTKVAELKAERELLVKQADALKALKVQAEGAERKTEEAGKHAADVAAGLGRRRADGRHRHGDGLPERRCAAAALRSGGNLMHKTALISDCGAFRYRLGRRWAYGHVLVFVMLNPSTADDTVDDRTIKRCISFAQSHGFAGLEVVNLFAFRTAYPRELRAAGYPVGPENDRHITAAVREHGAVCAAWGTAGAETRRPAEVLNLIRSLGSAPQYLRLTKTGHPEHPLYLPGELRLKRLTVQAIDDAMHGVR